MKELAAKQDIDPTLQDQIDDLVEERHLLVHRWIFERRFPSDSSEDAANEVLQVANHVESVAWKLTLQLLTYVLRHGTDDPTATSPIIQVREALTRLFHEMHLR